MGCGGSKAADNKPAAPRTRDVAVRSDTNVTQPPSQPVEMKETATYRKLYKGGGPSVEGGEVTPCFDDGMLFRIVKDNVWSFYNDTSDYEMHVSWLFGPESQLVSRDEQVTLAPKGADGWLDATMVIYPGETKEFVSGQPNGFKSSLSAQPLSEEYIQRATAEADAKIQAELDWIHSLNMGVDEEAILLKCVHECAPYVDVAFPPAHSSLSRPQDPRQLPKHAWKRPQDYLPEGTQCCLISKVEANDIDQGQLGDCWLLCSIAALAEIPSKVEDIFSHPDGEQWAAAEQHVGAYRVTLNKGGWWRVVIVDNYLPCVGNRPCFAKNREDPGELWVSVIEKAYAKVHGSYSSISGGDALYALTDLTGYPISRFDEAWAGARKDPHGAWAKKLFSFLKHYDDEGYLININTPGRDNKAYMGNEAGQGNDRDFEKKYEEAGLGMGHAYTVIKVKEFPEEDLRLLFIRNPWGDGTESTLAWGDDDPIWDEKPHIRDACNFNKEKDGCFWMPFHLVLEYFDGGGCCFTKMNWHDYRIKGKWTNGKPILALEVKVKKKVRAFVTLSQADSRGLPDNHPDKKYVAALLSVCKPSTEKGTLEMHKHATENADFPADEPTFRFGRDLGIEYNFQPSEEPYLVIPQAFEKSLEKDYVMGILSDTRVGADFSVKFKTLPANCNAFANYVTFAYNEATVPDISCPYQYNPEAGCPVTTEGIAVLGDVSHEPAGDVPSSHAPPEQIQQQDTKAPPPGYNWMFDEGSGMYWADDAAMYYCTERELFYEPNEGRWWKVENGEWVEAFP